MPDAVRAVRIHRRECYFFNFLQLSLVEPKLLTVSNALFLTVSSVEYIPAAAVAATN